MIDLLNFDPLEFLIVMGIVLNMVEMFDSYGSVVTAVLAFVGLAALVDKNELIFHFNDGSQF